jgi:patatin-like phospholipase/acyl hydrolase
MEKKNHEWRHCNYCVDYDECVECYELKKNEKKKHHPHKLELVKRGLYESNLNSDNILSFDGGGIRGYLSILMFDKYIRSLMLESESIHNPTDDQVDIWVSHFLPKKFNLICGTSIGGIIAVMLAMDFPLSTIKKIFPEKKGEIFNKEHSLTKAKYTDKGLHSVFTELFYKHRDRLRIRDKEKVKMVTDLTMGHIIQRCAVTTYDYITGKPHWFSSYEKSSAGIPVIDALLSTSAAPTYFPIHKFIYKERSIIVLMEVYGGMIPLFMDYLKKE